MGGGGNRIRTDDPLLAGQVLYQLSYTPVTSSDAGTAYPIPRIQNKCSANNSEHVCIKNE